MIVNNLHSNMDRLKLKDITQQLAELTDLHSNMDRLKQVRHRCRRLLLRRFTFQYG